MGSVQQRLQRFLDRPGPLSDLLGRLEARTGVRRLYLATGAPAAPPRDPFPAAEEPPHGDPSAPCPDFGCPHSPGVR